MKKLILTTFLMTEVATSANAASPRLQASQVPVSACRVAAVNHLKLDLANVYWDVAGEKYFPTKDGEALMMAHLEHKEDGVYQPYRYNCFFKIKSGEITNIGGEKSTVYPPTVSPRW